MKRLLPFFLFLGILLLGCGGESFSKKFPPGSTVEVRVSPSLFIKSEPLRGLEIELMQKLLRRMQLNGKWKEVPFEKLLPGLRSGRGDIALSSLTIIPERTRGLSFSKPYSERRILLLEGRGPSVVGARSYSFMEQEAKGMPGYRLRSTRNSREALQLLKQKKISRAWIEEEFYRPGSWKIIKEKSVGQGYAIATRHPLLAEEIDRQLERMQKDGSLDRLLKKYLPR
jgi:polar amino acid transport system substrate-binding protein